MATASTAFSAINIIKGPLYIASFKKENVSRVSHALLKIFLLPSLTPRLFSYTETNSEVTLLLDDNSLSSFHESGSNNPEVESLDPNSPTVYYGGLTVGKVRWRGLEVMLGSCGYTESGIVATLSSILSSSDINLYYLSTYNTDYILVPEDKLYLAISCLEKSLSVDITGDPEELAIINGINNGNDIVTIEEKTPDTTHTIFPLASSPPTSKVSISATKLVTIPNELCLASITRSELPLCMQAILRLIFFPNSPSCFFSFTETEGEVSMIMDTASALTFPFREGYELGIERPLLVDTAPWRAIRRIEKLSFTETGVVSAISTPLGNANISILYLSTFKTSFIMVRQDRLSEAVSTLRTGGFSVLDT
eukprot:TRINITY_DN1725_c0_g1_i1.p1 TRINITY_DN1725_c0_g1~~TRINITY_DN1725_c0_g1_i1.p1  ORF type:complete len:366 (-),score=51.54 TRINITY_DN1725_c0_g1_i1:51-1148(-)